MTSTNKVDNGQESELIFKDFSEPAESLIGYMIPLTCGHNGCIFEKEKEQYEMHLKNASFISAGGGSDR